MSVYMSLKVARSQVSPAALVKALLDWAAAENLDPDETSVYNWMEFYPDRSETRDNATLDDLRRLPSFPVSGHMTIGLGKRDETRTFTVGVGTLAAAANELELRVSAADAHYAEAVIAYLKAAFPPPLPDSTGAIPPPTAQYRADLEASLPLVRLTPQTAEAFWEAVIDPGLGMKLTFSSVSVTVHKRDYKFENVAQLLACDDLPDSILGLHMYACFAASDGSQNRNTISVIFRARPALHVSGESEQWAGGKAYQMQQAAARYRASYSWLRPWAYVNALVLLPWLLLFPATDWAVDLAEHGGPWWVALRLPLALLSMMTVGLLDAFVLKFTHSRIRRSAPGAWSRSDMIAVVLVIVTAIGIVVTALMAALSPRG